MIPPRGRWPPDQLAGAEGQGHPQRLWAAAARPGVISFPLHAAVGILLKNRKPKTGCWGEKDGGGEHFGRAASRVTPKKDGRRATARVTPWLAGRPDGGGQGCGQRGGLQGHWSPAAAGAGQGHPKKDGRRAAARVTPSFHGLPPLPPPSGHRAEASATRRTTLASPEGSVVLAAK